MKNKIFTIALSLMGSSFLFAQQWTGANNTTSIISRTGPVNINMNNAGSYYLNVGQAIYIDDNSTGSSSLNFSDYLVPPLNIIPSYSLVHKRSAGTKERGVFYIGSNIEKNIVIHGANYVGMGTDEFGCSDCTDYRLFVKDGIRTEKIKVDIAANNGWADYVFEPEYNLMPLADVEQFIKQNGHLPEVPTTEEAIANGIELKEMNILLLKKVEELTLYSIQQQKELEELKAQVNLLLKVQN